MFRRIKLILQLLFLQFTARSQAIPFDQLPFNNPLNSDFDSILHEQVRNFFKKSKAPGIFIGISRNGEKAFYDYGYADTASKKRFGSETVFEIGSITKTFAANLLFQLDAKGIVNADRSLASCIPGVDVNDSALSKITLKQIASHTSGLPRLPSDLDKINGYTMMQPYLHYTRNELYPFLKQLKNIRPGKYAYSNLGFGTLVSILENETKESFESLLYKYIWQPLGMSSSYVNTIKGRDSATGYFYGKAAPYWQFDCMAGAGAIKSNAVDMLKYLDGHIQPSNKGFSEVVDKITTRISSAGPAMDVAYGWHLMPELKHKLIWHNGGTYGFSTFCAFEPVTKNSIIVVSNSTGVNAALDKLSADLMILLMGN
jgi:CubicO group peptidase (beta-lactamase class C family)